MGHNCIGCCGCHEGREYKRDVDVQGMCVKVGYVGVMGAVGVIGVAGSKGHQCRALG